MKNQLLTLAICMIMQVATVKSQTKVVFNYTGSDQYYTVPTGVTEITVKAWGAGGAGGNYVFNDYGGGGGFAMGVLKVTPGDSILVIVGGGGKIGIGPGAYGGGGAKYNGYNSKGGRGGGRSAIRDITNNELLTAGGGGGGGGANTPAHCGAGGGGGLIGGYGNFGIYDGQPGTQTAGGIGGVNENTLCPCGSNNGVLYKGGDADAIDNGFNGSGGGGYYGGGSGTDYGDGAGGGGSSFIPQGGCTIGATNYLAANNTDVDYKYNAGLGGQQGNNGKNGRVVIYNHGFRVWGTVTPISTAGNCDGAITLIPKSGSAPYTYLWNDGNTQDIRTNLCAATYTITVTDALGCFKKVNRQLIDPPAFLSTTFSNASSKYCADGTLTATIQNFTPDSNPVFELYDGNNNLIETWYLNTDSNSSHTFTNLAAGIYKVVAHIGNQSASQSGTIDGLCSFSFSDIIIDSIISCGIFGEPVRLSLQYIGSAFDKIDIAMKYMENGIEKIDTFYKNDNYFSIWDNNSISTKTGVMLIGKNGSCIDSTYFYGNIHQPECEHYHSTTTSYNADGGAISSIYYPTSCHSGQLIMYVYGITNNIQRQGSGYTYNLPDGDYGVYWFDQVCFSDTQIVTISGAQWTAPTNLSASQIESSQSVKLKWYSNMYQTYDTPGFQIQVKKQSDTSWRDYSLPPGNQKSKFSKKVTNILSDTIYEWRVRVDWYNAGLWSPVQTFCIGSNCGSARTAVETENTEGNSILLNPNPANNCIIVSLPATDEQLFHIGVYNQLGNVVINKNSQAINGHIQLDLSSINNGVYLLVVSNGSITYSKKFVVSK